MKAKSNSRPFYVIPALGLTVFAAATASLAWFTSSRIGTDDKEAIDGQMGLRSYFYDGNGTKDFPYEIVMPNHLYNLSRLQNLGVFQNRTYYFQMGHDFSDDPSVKDFKCINTDAEGNKTYDKYLDMEEWCNVAYVASIGGEGAPFQGVFEGNNLTIKNLTVTGTPEDIGFFGYVALDGSVTDIILENITIKSVGYNPVSPYEELFGAEVDDIFNEHGRNGVFSQAKLNFKYASDAEIEIKSETGFGGLPKTSINTEENYIDVDGTYYYKGVFIPTFPTDPMFNYSWRFSTDVLEEYDDGTGVPKARVNLTTLKNIDKFNDGSNSEIDSRIYLIANKTIGSYTYSRVMGTYLAKFRSNTTSWDQGGYSLTIYCDYKGDDCTNYSHGNNVGYLAGHVDGTIKDCYVYGGSLALNGVSGMTAIKTETETGLVGEIGVNVDNKIDPHIGAVEKGDTGVMNFSGIYKMIRSDYELNEYAWSDYGYDTTATRKSIYSYNAKRADGFANYEEYLRCTPADEGATSHYIGAYDNKDLITVNGTQKQINTEDLRSQVNVVDFIPNRVIQDTPTIDRGLGVFELATAKANFTTYDPQTNYLDEIGSCKIVNGAAKTKVYYSTAEFDHTAFAGKTWADSLGVYAPTATNVYLETMDTVPSYADEKTFSTEYEATFNYNIEMNLEDSGKTGGSNYFFNIDNTFFQEYFKYKLIDKKGQHLNPGDERFGFMLRATSGELIDSVSSYMPVKRPSSKFGVQLLGGTVYYPSNCITFEIENSHGANVAVIAGAGSNVTIYSYDNSTSGTSDIVPLYSMYNYAPADKNMVADSLKYFTYDPINQGATTTEAATPDDPDMLTRNNKLYAHIFRIKEPGTYCIGSSSTAEASNIYMLAVQGQTEGTIGDVDLPSLGKAYVEVDFYVYDPEAENKRKKALYSFAATYNTGAGTFDVSGENGYLEMTFDESAGYTLSVFGHRREPDIGLYVNGEEIPLEEDYEYPSA